MQIREQPKHETWQMKQNCLYCNYTWHPRLQLKIKHQHPFILLTFMTLRLRCSLPTAGPLSAFLATGGLFVLLSILSPSTKQGSEVEVRHNGPWMLGSSPHLATWFKLTPPKTMEAWKIFWNKQLGHFFFESQVDGWFLGTPLGMAIFLGDEPWFLWVVFPNGALFSLTVHVVWPWPSYFP